MNYAALAADATELRRRAAQSARDKRRKRTTTTSWTIRLRGSVIVLIFCLVRVAGTYEQLPTFPYLHMIRFISAYAIIPWIAQHLLVINHMFV